jgi:hypothetical protein
MALAFLQKTQSEYPFAFDPITGRHGFKKTHHARLSDDERRALQRSRIKPPCQRPPLPQQTAAYKLSPRHQPSPQPQPR